MQSSEYDLTCHNIENNHNFKPDCTPKMLLDLVAGHTNTLRQALAIQPSKENCELGKVYKVLKTSYEGRTDVYEIPGDYSNSLYYNCLPPTWMVKFYKILY